MLVQILIDNPRSWMWDYAHKLKDNLESAGHYVKLLGSAEKVIKGDILCLLSCTKLFKGLHLNTHTLVAHASDLPKGKGWSPMTWQILEGKNEIPVTLFEAVESVDAGAIYDQELVRFEGHELLQELQAAIANAIVRLITNFVKKFPNVKGLEQSGNETFYKKRSPIDSQLDLNETIESQFNLLRICDNEQYPAFFTRNGYKYILKIEKV